MADSPNLGLERLVEGQASGEVTHNSAINKLDSLVMPGIKDRDLDTPPGGESEGDRYLVKAAGADAWNGHDGELAIYYSGWVFVTPAEGWQLWVDDENILIYYDGAAWQEVGILGASESVKGVTAFASEAEAKAGGITSKAIVPNTMYVAHMDWIKLVRKATSESLQNSTTLQNDDELKFAVLSGLVYHCRAVLFIQDETTGQTAHFKVKWTIPGAGKIYGHYILGDLGADDVDVMNVFTEADTIVLEPDGTDNTPVIFDFIAEADIGGGGDVQLQWAQNVLDAVEDVTVRGANDGMTSNLIARWLGLT